MTFATRPRTVAPPWAPRPARTVAVGREADVRPDPGPLELYRSAFPHRYVVWDAQEQLFAVRQLNPLTGVDELVDLVFEWGAPPEPEMARDWTDEELAELVGRYDSRCVKLFLPFDYEYVRARIRDAYLFLTEGADARTRIRMERNRRLRRRRTHALASEWAAGLGELGPRWLDVLAQAQAQKGRGDRRPLATIVKELKESRSPQVPGAVFAH